MNLIKLTEWAKARYGNNAPTVGTLRRWARNGNIQPPPQKHGRAYYVKSTAKYYDTITGIQS